MRENKDQKNSEYGHFFRSEFFFLSAHSMHQGFLQKEIVKKNFFNLQKVQTFSKSVLLLACYLISLEITLTIDANWTN